MDYRRLQAALLSKGHAEPDSGRDHVFYFIEVDGGEERATKISHSAHGQIDKETLSKIARQMRLTNKELRQFVACPLSREKWLALRQERGRLWG